MSLHKVKGVQNTPQELRDDFWKEDIQAGGGIFNQYKEIKRVLEDQDSSWILKKYRAVKAHAIAETPFYKGYSIEDNFPVVDKYTLLKNYEAHKAKSGFETPIHISSTSGSTGTPFSVIQDLKKRKRTIADLKVFGEMCNYPSHERMVFFRVLSDKCTRSPEQENTENIYYIDSSDLGEANLELMKNVLLEKKPRIVFSYSSTLVELAKYIERTGIFPDTFSMKSILTGGEGLNEENRQLLERVFECTVYRRYSDMELGILGQDDGKGSSYHLNWGSYYFEVLKIDCDERVEPGEAGRIVITDLFNYAFPMIRYDTGDLGVLEGTEVNELPKLQEIYGRVRDCVYTTDERLLSPAKISVSMWGVEGIRQWQFIQEGEKDYLLKVNCSGDVDMNSILDKLHYLLGVGATIAVQLTDDIPVLSSNKRRAIICNYKRT